MSFLQSIGTIITTIQGWIGMGTPTVLTINKLQALSRGVIADDIEGAGKEERKAVVLEKRQELDDLDPNLVAEKEVITPGFFAKMKRGIGNAIDFIASNATLRIVVLVITLAAAFSNPFGLAVGLAIFGATAAMTIGQFLIEGYQLNNLRKLQNENDVVKDIVEIDTKKHQILLESPELQTLLSSHKKEGVLHGLGNISINPKTLKVEFNKYTVPNIGQHSRSAIGSIIKGVGDTALENGTTAISIANMALSAANPLTLLPNVASLIMDNAVSAGARWARDRENAKLQNDMERNKALYELDFVNGKGLPYLDLAKVYRQLELETLEEVKKGLDDVRKQAVLDVMIGVGAKKERITEAIPDKVIAIQSSMDDIAKLDQIIAISKIEKDNLRDARTYKNSEYYKENVKPTEDKVSELQKERKILVQERDELQRSKDKIVLQGHTPPKEEEAFFLKNATKQLKALEKDIKRLDKKILPFQEKLDVEYETFLSKTNISVKYYAKSDDELKEELNKNESRIKELETKVGEIRERIKEDAKDTAYKEDPFVAISEQRSKILQEEFSKALVIKIEDQARIEQKIKDYKHLHDPSKGIVKTAWELAGTFSYEKATAKIAPRYKHSDHRDNITNKVGLNTDMMKRKVSEVQIQLAPDNVLRVPNEETPREVNSGALPLELGTEDDKNKIEEMEKKKSEVSQLPDKEDDVVKVEVKKNEGEGNALPADDAKQIGIIALDVVQATFGHYESLPDAIEPKDIGKTPPSLLGTQASRQNITRKEPKEVHKAIIDEHNKEPGTTTAPEVGGIGKA